MSGGRSAAAHAAPLWREALERVLRSLAQRGPLNERKRVARSIEQTIVSMQRLEETLLLDPRHLAVLDEALASLESACQTAEKLRDGGEAKRRLEQVSTAMQRARLETLDQVVDAQANVPRSVAPEPQGAIAFVASTGMPRVHAPVRPFVKPTHERDDVDLDEAWRTLEREAAEAERGEPIDEALMVPGGEAPSSWDASALVLRHLARDALEDIGVMGLLRRVKGRSRRHDAIARFEQRLLDNVDALVALSFGEDGIDVLAETRRFADDAFTHDPMRAFARTFVLGCIKGADPVRAALGALRRATSYTREAQIEALALAPSSEVGPAMRRLSADDDPTLVRAALEVLRFRGESDFGTAAIPLSHTDRQVRAAAARCLAQCQERAAAREVLEHALADEPDRECAAVMAECLLVLDAPRALVHVRAALADASRAARPDRADRAYLRLLSVGGAARDADLLAAWASDAPSWTRAVGWFGSAALVEVMLARHDGTHDYRARRIAHAIERLAGEQLLEDSLRFSIDPRQWRAWWSDRRLAGDKRLRRGEPYAAHQSIAELEQSGARGDDRELCALEIAIVSGGRACIEPHTWVARQAQQAAAARTLLDEDERAKSWHRPGEWLAERLGKRG